MLLDYLPIAVLLIMSAGLAAITVILGHLVGPKRPTKRKSETYESGMKPIGPGTRRMPIRFYMVAVLFILFDIEVIFFLPWAVVFRQFGLPSLIEMFVFILILLVGYVYAWKMGALDWD